MIQSVLNETKERRAVITKSISKFLRKKNKFLLFTSVACYCCTFPAMVFTDAAG